MLRSQNTDLRGRTLTLIFSQLLGKSNSKLGERRYHFLVPRLLGGVKMKELKFIYSTTDVNRVIKGGYVYN